MTGTRRLTQGTFQAAAFSLCIAMSTTAYAENAIEYAFVGAVFEDGGELQGGFTWRPINLAPLPQFYNIDILTTQGATSPGSRYTVATVCYDNHKKPVCAPGDNLLMYMETGVYGEPGYERFQFGTYFAPGAPNLTGVLSPAVSYEMSCVQEGCFTRRVVSGRLRPVANVWSPGTGPAH